MSRCAVRAPRRPGAGQGRGVPGRWVPTRTCRRRWPGRSGEWSAVPGTCPPATSCRCARWAAPASSPPLFRTPRGVSRVAPAVEVHAALREPGSIPTTRPADRGLPQARCGGGLRSALPRRGGRGTGPVGPARRWSSPLPLLLRQGRLPVGCRGRPMLISDTDFRPPCPVPHRSTWSSTATLRMWCSGSSNAARRWWLCVCTPRSSPGSSTARSSGCRSNPSAMSS